MNYYYYFVVGRRCSDAQCTHTHKHNHIHWVRQDSHTQAAWHPNEQLFGSFAIDSAASRIYLFFIYTLASICGVGGQRERETCSVNCALDTAANYLLIVLMGNEIEHAERLWRDETIFIGILFELNGKTCFA